MALIITGIAKAKRANGTVEENRGCATELNSATSDRRSEKHAFKPPSYAGGSHCSNAEEPAVRKAADGPQGSGEERSSRSKKAGVVEQPTE